MVLVVPPGLIIMFLQCKDELDVSDAECGETEDDARRVMFNCRTFDVSSVNCLSKVRWFHRILNCSCCLGLCSACPICFHRGHLSHMEQWFDSYSQCPTGCGCLCNQ